MDKKKVVITAGILIIFIVIAIFGYIKFTGYAVYSPSKIKIDMLQDAVKPGENVSFTINIYDSENVPVRTSILAKIEDANKMIVAEKTVESGKKEEMQMPQDAGFGYWKLVAQYKDSENKIIEDSYLFSVEMTEGVRFGMEGDSLIIENLGNAVYDKEIQIAIGDTIGKKLITLGIGEKTSIRLTAPDGIYNIKVTDGKTTFSRSDVSLTGNVVGVLDEKQIVGSPITGINPEKDIFTISHFVKKQRFMYFFLAAVVGAAILLAIERNYRKKLGS